MGAVPLSTSELRDALVDSMYKLLDHPDELSNTFEHLDTLMERDDANSWPSFWMNIRYADTSALRHCNRSMG